VLHRALMYLSSTNKKLRLIQFRATAANTRRHGSGGCGGVSVLVGDITGIPGRVAVGERNGVAVRSASGTAVVEGTGRGGEVFGRESGV